MAAEAQHSASAPAVARALREAAFAGLIAFGLFLPLIGFVTVQNIRNELVLETRWPLLATLVLLVAGGRLLHALVIAPALARSARRPPSALIARLRAFLGRFGIPADDAFAVDRMPAGRAVLAIPLALRDLAARTRFTAEEAHALDTGLRMVIAGAKPTP